MKVVLGRRLNCNYWTYLNHCLEIDKVDEKIRLDWQLIICNFLVFRITHY